MRVTTNMTMRNYNSRLNRVLGNLNMANEKVTTRREFLSAEEAPASAARAYQLRRNMQKNADYMNNIENVLDTFTSAEGNLMNISELAETAYVDTLEAINGTNGLSERKIVAQQLRSIQSSMIMNLNAQFDDKFLFGGSSTKGLPFELTTDGEGNQTLTYRGIDVTDPASQADLKALAGEKMYVDIGFGLKEDGAGLVDSSVFNTALPGINVIGYGEDPTDNLILNLGKLADLLEQDTLDKDAIKGCTEKLKEQHTNVLVNVTRMGSDYQFLSQTKNVLEDNEFNLNNKIVDVEYIDMEEAIMAFKEADYIYRAALKMGNNILSLSFIDFMR